MSLNFEACYNELVTYFQYNIYIATALTGVLLLLMFRKPKLFFTILLIVSLNLSLLYVISYTSSLGKAQKNHLLQKSILQVSAY